MKNFRATLALAGLAVLIAVACGDGGGPPPPDLDVPRLLAGARAAMEGLRSYRIEGAFEGEGKGRALIEWAQPESYHYILPIIEETRTGGPLRPGETPRPKVSRRQVGIIEGIVIGDTVFDRNCGDVNEDCTGWQESLRPRESLPIPSPDFLPQWPLEALTMARQAQAVREETIDGEPVIRVQALVNHRRAIVEVQRELYVARGALNFGTECEQTPSGAEVCHQITLEELLEAEEPRLSFYDQNPTSMELWIGIEDNLLRKAAFVIALQDEPGKWARIRFEFSAFNEVEIERPR